MKKQILLFSCDCEGFEPTFLIHDNLHEEGDSLQCPGRDSIHPTPSNPHGIIYSNALRDGQSTLL